MAQRRTRGRDGAVVWHLVTTPKSRESILLITFGRLVRPKAGDRFEWSEEVQGLLLSSFYWGYVLTQIPGGLVADRFGGKHTLTAGMVLSIVATAASPLAVRMAGWPGMLVTRVACGLGQGAVFPALNVLLAAWVPVEERGKLGALVLSGSNLGTVAGTAISGTLIHMLASWDVVFYSFAAAASVWTVCWCVLCFDSPAAHPYITSGESKYLQDKLSHKHGKVRMKEAEGRDSRTRVLPFIERFLLAVSTGQRTRALEGHPHLAATVGSGGQDRGPRLGFLHHDR